MRSAAFINIVLEITLSSFDAAATVILSKQSASKEAVAALLRMSTLTQMQDYLIVPARETGGLESERY